MKVELKMNTKHIRTLKDIEELLKLSTKILKTLGIKFVNKGQAYKWISNILDKFKYEYIRKKHKTLVRKYIMLCSGYSRQQLDRLINRYRKYGKIETRYKERESMGRYKVKYTYEDIKLMATTDELHDYPSGAALKRIMYRMYKVYKKKEYKRYQ